MNLKFDFLRFRPSGFSVEINHGRVLSAADTEEAGHDGET